MMETIITIAALLVVAAVSAIAVFHPSFNDTLIQRICLVGFCFFALSMAWWAYQNGSATDDLMVGSTIAALYGIESCRKTL